jgi:hypothetical protein
MPLAEPIQIGSVIIASPALKKTPIPASKNYYSYQDARPVFFGRY